MVQFLDELQGKAEPPLSSEELVELEQLRAKYDRLKKVGPAAEPGTATTVGAAKKGKKKPVESDEESSSDSEVSLITSTMVERAKSTTDI